MNVTFAGGIVLTEGRLSVGPTSSGLSSFATWTPPETNLSFTLGNLKATHSGAGQHDGDRAGVGGETFVSSQKWYWEINIDQGSGANVRNGIANATWVDSGPGQEFLGNDVNSWSYEPDGQKRHTNSLSTYGSSQTTGDKVGVALDMDTGAIWFSKNGIWQASATISEIEVGDTTNAAFTGITGSVSPAFSMFAFLASLTANFGASPFTHTVPTGFISGFGNE